MRIGIPAETRAGQARAAKTAKTAEMAEMAKTAKNMSCHVAAFEKEPRAKEAAK